MSGWGSDPWHGHHQHLHHLTLACRTWRAHRLLCDDTLERDGLHGGLLLRSGSGRHFELRDVTSIRFCAVGVWRGGYRLQACQRGRKECWRGEDEQPGFHGEATGHLFVQRPRRAPVLPFRSRNGRTREPTQGQTGGGEVRQSFWIGHRPEAIRRSPCSQVSRHIVAVQSRPAGWDAGTPYWPGGW